MPPKYRKAFFLPLFSPFRKEKEAGGMREVLF
jgi:hypothetical protein